MQECTKRNVSTETKCRFHVFQDERFVDLNLYQYGWEQTEPLHSYGPYARNHYLFHYVISGKGLLLANEQEYTIEGGHGFLIAPGQVTTYRADEQEPWEYTWIEFDGLRAHEALNLAGISGQNPVYSPASTKAGQLLQEQMLFLVNHSQDSPMRQIGYGFLFLDQLVQSSASHQAQSPRRLRDFYMKEALSFIEQHYSEDISIEDISSFCGLNRSYFSKVFRDTMGESPQGFLLHYRMARAAQLLTESRLPISTISTMVSYPRSAIPISSTFPVRSKMYMASVHGTIVQSILHYKNWSHSPLYAFRFFRHIKTPHLSDRIPSDKWGVVHSGAHSVFYFAFNLLTNGSRLWFSSISPGHHSKSNQHSSAGHYR